MHMTPRPVVFQKPGHLHLEVLHFSIRHVLLEYFLSEAELLHYGWPLMVSMLGLAGKLTVGYIKCFFKWLFLGAWCSWDCLHVCVQVRSHVLVPLEAMSVSHPISSLGLELPIALPLPSVCASRRWCSCLYSKRFPASPSLVPFIWLPLFSKVFYGSCSRIFQELCKLKFICSLYKLKLGPKLHPP